MQSWNQEQQRGWRCQISCFCAETDVVLYHSPWAYTLGNDIGTCTLYPPLLELRGIMDRMSMLSAGGPIVVLRAQACYFKTRNANNRHSDPLQKWRGVVRRVIILVHVGLRSALDLFQQEIDDTMGQCISTENWASGFTGLRKPVCTAKVAETLCGFVLSSSSF